MIETLLQVLFWLSVGALIYSYLGYPLLLALAGRWFGRPVRRDEACLPTVGVVIPVHNEERRVARKLRNLFELDYPPDRLVVWVGLDCCTDRTLESVRSCADRRIRIWNAPERCGKTGILNQLVPRTGTELVLLTDVDTLHEPASLRALVSNFADSTVGAATGPLRTVGDGCYLAEESAYRALEARLKLLESRLHSTIGVPGACYAIRRSLFQPIPSTAYSNDDVLIPLAVVRRGFRVVSDERARATEITSGTLAAQFARRARSGAGAFQAFFWQLGFLIPHSFWPWFCYLSHKVGRWFSWALISGALVSGLAAWLLTRSPLIGVTLAGALALILVGLSYLVLPSRVSRGLCYFIAMNAALAVGFARYCRGIPSAAWNRSESPETAAAADDRGGATLAGSPTGLRR